MVKAFILIILYQLIVVNCLQQCDPAVSSILPLSTDNTANITWETSGWKIIVNGGAHLKLYLNTFCNTSLALASFTHNVSECDTTQSQHQISFDSELGLYYFEESFASTEVLYLCILKQNDTHWLHQGNLSTKILDITVEKSGEPTFNLPLGVKILFIAISLSLSGLFSGLNLGLMSLDLADLRVLQEAGSYKEKYYASAIFPLRKRGNFLLCSILLANTFVNSIQTILLNDIMTGIYATVSSTILIVVFGEIVPQAICSKYGLVIGAKTAWFTRFLMIVTSPLSWPFGKVLDFFLGKNAPSTFTREKIRVLLREQVSDVEPREIDIITGVLALKHKTAEEHMRKLKDVFMVDYDDPFEEKLFVSICDSGYSRIPVYRDRRSNVVGVLHIKDLALISTSLHRTVGTICESFNLPFGQCSPKDNLDKLLRSIQQNHFHMLLVQTEVAPNQIETIGTITLEDIIEEMLEFEILDEYDRTMEEKGRRYWNYRTSFDKYKSSIPHQLKIGALQFLPTLGPFSSTIMSLEVLNKLIEQCYKEDKIVSQKVFYEMGKPCDYFMLILTGKATLEAGVEKLKFEAGAFSYFGSPALGTTVPDGSKDTLAQAKANPYIPDFTLHTNEDISYLKITKSQWLAAARVSAFERLDSKTSNPATESNVETANTISDTFVSAKNSSSFNNQILIEDNPPPAYDDNPENYVEKKVSDVIKVNSNVPNDVVKEKHQN